MAKTEIIGTDANTEPMKLLRLDTSEMIIIKNDVKSIFYKFVYQEIIYKCVIMVVFKDVFYNMFILNLTRKFLKSPC